MDAETAGVRYIFFCVQRCNHSLKEDILRTDVYTKNFQ